jgi:hypothetical protein
MSTRARRLPAIVAAAMAAALLPASVLAADVTVQVNPSDLGVTWSFANLADGTGMFVEGPASPPLGVGSFEMTTTTPDDKSTLVTSDWTGDSLSDLSGLTYSTYRDGASSSPSFVAPSINVAIFTNATGPGTGFATLVFEPLYSYGNGAVQDDVWQSWDAFAPTQTGFAGGWWTTRQVGSICPTACYVDFGTILANAPDATIVSVGVNVGRGPASFVGAVDALALTMAGDTTTYDFEPLDLDKDACKEGGWVDFHGPVFKNQGDCVSYFATGGRNDADGDVAKSAAKAAAQADRVAAKLARAEAKALAKAGATRTSTPSSDPTTQQSDPGKAPKAKADKAKADKATSAKPGKGDKRKGG